MLAEDVLDNSSIELGREDGAGGVCMSLARFHRPTGDLPSSSLPSFLPATGEGHGLTEIL